MKVERITGVLTAIGFALSLTVNLAAVGGIDLLGQFALALPLMHIGALAGFFALLNALDRRYNGPGGSWWQPKRFSAAQIFGPLPNWVKPATYVMQAYAVACFLAAFVWATPLGTIMAERDGKYFVTDKQGEREVGHLEYNMRSSHGAAGWSAIWMIFYFIPAVYFLTAKEKA